MVASKKNMNKKIIQTESAPAAIGPYSQAVAAAEMVFTAGQIPVDPATGKMIAGGITEQTRQVLQNLEAVLTASGAALESVIKTTVYLQDMTEFAAMNQVYAEFFTQNPPARSTVEVAGLPLLARVEIEAIALRQ